MTTSLTAISGRPVSRASSARAARSPRVSAPWETRAAIHALAVTGFGSEFAIDITVQDSLPRTASGKLLAFVSALPAAVET